MSEYLDRAWKDNPAFIRQYYELLPGYQNLCEEVLYILETKIKKSGVETGSFSSRVKNLPSLCEKIERKVYKDPFNEVVDLAGVRVVYLYLSELENIQNIIEAEFEVVEKEDKATSQDTDRFGYGALHYVVKIKKQHSGARYDSLKDLLCEIQVRTILQDAWAIVAHHLSYKNEKDIPKTLQRKLNALSGLFETADDQFNQIRDLRSKYQSQITEQISSNPALSLDQEINLDNLAAYVNWKLSKREAVDVRDFADLLTELQGAGYKQLAEIDAVIDRAYDAVIFYEKADPPIIPPEGDNWDDEELATAEFNSIGFVRSALRLADENYNKKHYERLGLKYRSDPYLLEARQLVKHES